MIVKLGKSGERCVCNVGTECPLGKLGMEERCSKQELEAAGHFVTCEDFDGTYPGPPEGKVLKMFTKKDGQKAAEGDSNP
jgi:hypothetical protein